MPDTRFVWVSDGHDKLKSVIRSIGDAYGDLEAQANKALGSFPKAAAKAGRGAAGASRGAAKQVSEAWSSAKRPMSETEKLGLKVARDQERAAKKAADAQIREARRAARVQQGLDRQRERDVRSHLDRRTKLQERHERDLARRTEQRREARGSRIRGAIAAIGGAAITGAGAVMGAGALVGGRALRESLALDDFSKRLAIKGGEGFDANRLRRGFEATAVGVRGAKAADIAAGVDEFVGKTGNMQLGIDLQRTMAEFSVATGTDTSALAGAMADLFEKFDVKTVEEMADAMAILTVQGKQGSFELEDAAKQFPKLAAAAGSFGIGKGAGAVATLGGLTQIARTATGSPEQAASALEATFRQLTAQSTKLKTAGVNVFDKQGNARNITDILVESIAKVGGTDMEKKKVGLQKIFGEEGIRALRPLIMEYAEATAKGADGVDALRRRIARATETSGAYAEVQRDLASAQQQSSAALTSVWESLKAQVGQEVTPAFAALLGAVSSLADAGVFSPLVTTMHALAEAGQLAVDKLKEFGIVGDRSPEEHIRDADAAIAKASVTRESLFAKVRSGGTLSDVEMTQLNSLNSEIERQHNIKRSAETQWQSMSDRANETVSAEEFVKRYLSADRATFDFASDTHRENRAKGIAESIIADPMANVGPDIRHSDEQLAIIQQLRDQITQMQNTTDQGVRNEMKDALLGGKELRDAAGALKEAAGAIKGAAVASNLPG